MAILEQLALKDNICQLYDYGIDSDSFYLVMKHYRCSLKQWRERQSQQPERQLALYINIFKQILQGVKVSRHMDDACNLCAQPDPMSDVALAPVAWRSRVRAAYCLAIISITPLHISAVHLKLVVAVVQELQAQNIVHFDLVSIPSEPLNFLLCST